MRSLQNGLIGYHIMSHLTPGPGTEALVAWHPERDDAGADLDPSKRAAWMTRPSWIALVHELIHGWRLVTGQCVFRPDQYIEEYYEEAMTVGLPPYDGCRFTENKFRMASGQAAANVLRTEHESHQRGRSAKAQTYDGQVSLGAWRSESSLRSPSPRHAHISGPERGTVQA